MANFLGNLNHTMGGWLGLGAKSPGTPTTPPPVPTASNSAAATDAAALEEMRRRQAGGRSSTILNGGAGLADTGTVSSSSVMGS